ARPVTSATAPNPMAGNATSVSATVTAPTTNLEVQLGWVEQTDGKWSAVRKSGVVYPADHEGLNSASEVFSLIGPEQLRSGLWIGLGGPGGVEVAQDDWLVGSSGPK